MNFRRHGVWLMLVLTFAWAALPAAACLLPSAAGHRHACCQGMMESCSPSMDAQAPCCQLSSPAPVTAPVLLASPMQAKAILITQADAMALVTGAHAQWRGSFDAPPPDPSPGGISILRI